MHDLISDITLSILFAWMLGLLAHVTRQPLILAYLVGGFVIGPYGIGWVKSDQSISTISELGLIFMLFMIGLEIDLKKIVRAGRVILFAAGGQLLGGCVLGVLMFLAMGLGLGAGRFDALYLAVACALSSTVIIVKVLYEKRELDTLPGRITLGVLVLQDIFAILFLAVQPSLDNLQISVILLSVARVAVLVTTAWVLSRYVLPKLFHQIARRPELVMLGALVAASLAISRYVLPWLFHRVARQPELVVVGAIAWCFFVAQFAARLDLSREMGALIAGVSLSTFPYALDVTAKVTALRDFFITLFFVALGMTIPLPTPAVIGLAMVLTGFTLLSRVVTVFPPLYAMKQGIRASILPAINLAQISEFSLVLIQVGVQSRQVALESASAASFAFVVLAVLSTFLMSRSDQLSRTAVSGLKRLGVHDLDHAESDAAESGHGNYKILLLGFYRTASSFLSEVERQHASLLGDLCVIDFNPVVHRELKARNVKVLYGDIANTETLSHAGLSTAQIVISSVPDSLLKGTSNEKLVRYVRALNPTAKIIAAADTLAQVEELYAAGADFVTTARVAEAGELLDAVTAAQDGLLGDLRARVEPLLRDRHEVLP
jgi:Kef-type K+ transport system membrane component KefB